MVIMLLQFQVITREAPCDTQKVVPENWGMQLCGATKEIVSGKRLCNKRDCQ